MVKLFVLFEHASGYGLFKTDASEENLDAVKESASKDSFKESTKCVAFQPFKTGREALENINSISEGILPPSLQAFLENNFPQKKKKNVLGICEPKLGAAISEKLEIPCQSNVLVAELTRGIRFHFHTIVDGFESLQAANKSQLGLGHSYSRARVKFNVNKIDNMIIQSISLVDQLDKDINTFTMRVREWYSHHFPELIKIVPDNTSFVQCVKVIRDRKNLHEGIEEQLGEILDDPVKVENVMEVARSSMGMDISSIDLENVYEFAERIISLTQRRKELMEYLRNKMNSVSPNLAALIGDVVGARLIAHAGSLINLAKYPASTVQILGAEKALFRALKTKGNTPKYGLIYHSRFITKAAKANKGRISRYLANKCSVASRIDCFRDIPTTIFGEKLRTQVEDRLKFYETGELPPKNVDVMEKAMEEAVVADEITLKAIKKAKKKAKKAKKLKDESMNSDGLSDSMMDESVAADNESTPLNGDVSGKKKKRKSEMLDESVAADNESTPLNGDVSGKKKKKRKSEMLDESVAGDNESTPLNGDVSGKKKKRKSEAAQDESASFAETGLDGDLSSSIKKKKKKSMGGDSPIKIKKEKI